MISLLLGLVFSAHAGWTLHESPTGARQWVSVPAEAEITGHRGVVSLPELVVECDRKRLTVYVHTPGIRPEVQADLYDGFLALTRQKLDDELAEDEFMRKDIKDEAMHYRRARKALEALRRHETLIFAFQPFGAEPTETRFTLTGLEDAMAPFHKRCRK